MNIEIKKSKKPVKYEEAIKLMESKLREIDQKNSNDLIWILEHEDIYTAGTSYLDNEIIDKSIKLIKTNRGGKITLHNPGQRIVYFVINLNKRKKDIRLFINTIEKSIIEVLNKYNIKAYSDRKNIGIWVKNKKIAAIGVRVKNWIAYHGCSININNNLNDYLKIKPCGLDNRKVTSLFNEKKKLFIDIDKKIIKVFKKNFEKI